MVWSVRLHDSMDDDHLHESTQGKVCTPDRGSRGVGSASERRHILMCSFDAGCGATACEIGDKKFDESGIRTHALSDQMYLVI